MQSGVTTLFKGHDGKISATRVSTLIVVLTVMSTFAAHNVIALIRTPGVFVSMGLNEVILVTSVLGCKIAQHFSEAKTLKTSTTVNSSISSGTASTINPTVNEDANMAKG